MKDLWSLAAEECAAKVADAPVERTLFVCGAKHAGKSTFVSTFLENAQSVKPTVALDYSYEYRTSASGKKDLGHIYELGGGTWLTKLLSVPLTPRALERLTVCIVVDLSKPDELWWTLETLLAALGSAIDTALRGEPALAARLAATSAAASGEHPDSAVLSRITKPFPVPLTIVGAKYDLFQAMQPQQRTLISKTLRFLAHANGAALLFFSHKQEVTAKKARVLLSHALFGSQASKTPQLEDSKPIWLPAWSDSLAKIGTPPGDGDAGRFRDPMSLWKDAFVTAFPQQALTNPAMQESPADAPEFAEAAIDAARRERDTALAEYRRQSERAARQKAALQADRHIVA